MKWLGEGSHPLISYSGGRIQGGDASIVEDSLSAPDVEDSFSLLKSRTSKEIRRQGT